MLMIDYAIDEQEIFFIQSADGDLTEHDENQRISKDSRCIVLLVSNWTGCQLDCLDKGHKHVLYDIKC